VNRLPLRIHIYKRFIRTIALKMNLTGNQPLPVPDSPLYQNSCLIRFAAIEISS
jgi:hypothetical protein